MIEPLLQLGFRTAGPLSTALSIVTSILGLAVGYVAFRGYRRNESLPMLFVAVGFLLTFWTPILLLGSRLAVETFATVAPDLRTSLPVAVSLAGTVSQIVGLLCILYGLRMPIRR